MNRELRRWLGESISLKRWKKFHQYTSRFFGGDWSRGVFFSITYPRHYGPPVGFYRKKKGCECRGCTSQHQSEKYRKNEQLRTAFRTHKSDIIEDI